MLLSFEPCWWATGSESASEYLCVIDDAHLCDRCLKMHAALDRLEAEVRLAALDGCMHCDASCGGGCELETRKAEAARDAAKQRQEAMR